MLSRLTASGRRRAYRRGRPVLIRVRVGAPYQWATHLLCHGGQLWAISALGRPAERRLELHADEGAVELPRRSVAVIPVGGCQVELAARSDGELLRRAVRRWERRGQWVRADFTSHP